MDLLIDVGNTTIVVGGFLNRIVFKEIERTDLCKNEKFLSSFIDKIINEHNINNCDVNNIIISSVVLEINAIINSILRNFFVDSSIYKVSEIRNDLKVEIDDPISLGEDLICDLVAAKNKFNHSFIVCDCGTVTKMLVVEKDGYFRNCSFFLGIESELKTLSSKTSLLPETQLNNKVDVYAHNTIDALNVGVLYSHIHSIKGLLAEYKKIFGYDFKLILTGGNAIYIKDYLDFEFYYVESLVLEGLIELLKMVRK